jgi:hypothetical protein
MNSQGSVKHDWFTVIGCELLVVSLILIQGFRIYLNIDYCRSLIIRDKITFTPIPPLLYNTLADC